MLGRSNAGPQEDGGAAKHARGQDNFACRENLAIDELHANGALPFDNDAVYFSVTTDRKVGASADRCSEISHPGVDTHTIDDVERIRADAMLGCAVEIRYTRQTDSCRGFNEGPHRRRVLLRCSLADRKRAAAAVPGVIAGRRVFQCLVRGQHLLPRPYDMSTREMLSGLRDGKLDVALLIEVPPKVVTGIVFKELCRYGVWLATHPAHPLARARKVTLEQVANEPLIAYTRADYPEYHGWLSDL